VRVAALAWALWLCTCAGGLAFATWRSAQPGLAAAAPRMLPAALATPGDTRAQLLVFAHPQCPCTHATFAELERVLARTHARVHVRVWFYADETRAETWTHSAAWKVAAAIPGVEVLADPRGTLAQSLGVATSGALLLYDERGELVFDGGITPARGHEGDSDGQIALLAALDGRHTQLVTTPVFGCGLRTPVEPAEQRP
jgi:hypothetical protein